MEYNNGSGYAYDQVYANTQLDSYDAPYTTITGDPPHRTMKSAQMPPRNPVASYYETARRPYYSLDSSLLGPENPEAYHLDGTTHPLRSCRCSRGIPGPIGKILDCGCGCRGGKRISQLREVKDKLLAGDVDLNNVYMFFIFMLAVILIVNSMNMRYLKDQVKMLTKAVSRTPLTGPGPP